MFVTTLFHQPQMSLFARGWLAVVAVLGAAWCGECPRAAAAEIQFRAKASASGALILLGDVANIYANDPQAAQHLANLELRPAPLPDQQLTLSVVDIQRTLLHRGADLSSHRFSGAASVVVTAGGMPAAESKPGKARADHPPLAPRSTPLSNSHVRQAEQKLTAAIVSFLKHRVSADEPWSVSLRWNPAAQRAAAECVSCSVARETTAGGNAVTLASAADPGGAGGSAGAASAWLGTRTFAIAFDLPNRQEQLEVTAVVSLLPSVVIATTAISKGTILQREHLQLQRGVQAAATDACHSIEDLLGQEALQNMAAGQILSAGLVREPELVRRGEVVTVLVHSSGVRLRMEARARESGRRGEMVLVESLADRSLFHARVSALQTVDVLARGTSLAADPPARRPREDWVR